MMAKLRQVRARLDTARRFSAAAFSWRDRAPLWLAGIARHRPFSGSGLYPALGRACATEVTPRLRGAGGHRLALDLRDATDLMILEEIFLDGIYPLDEVPFTPDAVVDCGACAGFFTVLAHARYSAAQYHLFEPNPANLTRLQRNLGLNRIAANIQPAAVGHQAGRARFSGEGFGGHLSASGEASSLDRKSVV